MDGLLDCGISNLKADIYARNVKFLKAQQTSPSSEVRVVGNMVSRDVRTTTGGNIALIERETGLPLKSTSGKVVRETMYKSKKPHPKQEDIWRIPFLWKLLAERGEKHFKMEETSDLTEITNFSLQMK